MTELEAGRSRALQESKNNLLQAEKFFREDKLYEGATRLGLAEKELQVAGRYEWRNEVEKMRKKLLKIIGFYNEGKREIATRLFEAFKTEYKKFLKEIPT